MKKRLSNLSILFFSFPLIFLQCSKEEAVVKEPEAVEEEEKDVITDPFYAVINEKSTLEDYWDLFVKDAIRSGKPDPGEGRLVSVFFLDRA